MIVTDIIKVIPDILSLLIPGFITIQVFRHFSYKDKKSEEHKYILYSITLSFLYKILSDLIIPNAELNVKIIVILSFSIIIAIIASKIPFINRAANRSGTLNIWNDLCLITKKTNLTVRIIMTNGTIYYGFLYIVAEKDEPEIVLKSYKVYKIENDEEVLKYDYSNDTDYIKLIMIKTKDVQFVEFLMYPKKRETIGK